MNALIAPSLPALPTTLFHLLTHARRGLLDPADMPRIEQHARHASINQHWLKRYRDCIALTDDGRPDLPPLALQIAVAPIHLALISDARFPFRALGLVHLSQHIIQTRSVPVDAQFDVKCYTTNARWEKRGMSFGIVTEVHINRKLAWRGETRALARMSSPLSAVTARPVRTERQPAQCLARLLVPENTGRRYASIAGDRNPIHQHALLARPFGFRRAIVHGTWTLARALALADLPATGAYTLDAQFRRPVELPSEIAIGIDRDAPKGHSRIVVAAPDGRIHLDIDIHSNKPTSQGRHAAPSA